MAQTAHVTVHDGGPIDITAAPFAAADLAAWLAAAKARKFRVDENQVWVYTDGRLLPVPPLAGFASLPELVQPFVFHATMQFGAYRIGQTAEGEITTAIANAFGKGEIPPAKTNDAYDAAYSDGIAALIEAKLGALPDNATKEAKAERRTQIEDTCAAQMDKRFDSLVAAAKANTTRPTTEKKRKPANTVKNAVVLD